MKFFIKDFVSQCGLICSFPIWLYLLEEPLMKNYIFCAGNGTDQNEAKSRPLTQLAFTRSRLTVETPHQCVNSIQS